MQIRIDDIELTAALTRLLPPEVSGVTVQIVPGLVHIHGTYKKIVGINFRLDWTLRAEAGKILADLVAFRAAGMPMFKALVMRHLHDITGVTVLDGDTVAIHTEYAQVTSIVCDNGYLTLFVNPALKESSE